MAVHVGIDLSPVACRIVELDSGVTLGRARRDTRVRSFARLARSAMERHAKRGLLGRRHVAVVAWGLAGDHRQAVVRAGSHQQMRLEALEAARRAGVDTRAMIADVARGSPQQAPTAQRPVIVALARAREIAEVLRVLTGAGLRVQSIVTPALALMSLARLRRTFTTPDVLEIYVAVEEAATAVALVQSGTLAAARELEWGYRDDRRQTRPRDEIAGQLGDDITRFLETYGLDTRAISQVCVCGGLPELRSMTVPLMERLDVEVETLDSLFGIDMTSLPEPALEFREHAAEFRLAWAIAADWHAPINLLRERRRRRAKTTLARAAVLAGVAAGVGVAWRVGQSDWWQRPARPNGDRASPAPLNSVGAGPPIAPASVATAPRAAADRPDGVLLPPAVQRPVIRSQPSELLTREAPLPFDAALGTILYAPDRKLAIVDDRIVQVGDVVRGAAVVEITATVVLLRDAEGRLRRLALGESRR